MYEELREKNRLDAFKHYVTAWKKQNATTIEVHGDFYCYKTKKGIIKKFWAVSKFSDYKNSEFYNNELIKVNGFMFVEIS